MAAMVVLLAPHFSLSVIVQTGQRFELFLFPLLVGAFAALSGRVTPMLQAYVVSATVLAVAWPLDLLGGQKNPVGGLIGNAIMLLVGVPALRRLYPCLIVLAPGPASHPEPWRDHRDRRRRRGDDGDAAAQRPAVATRARAARPDRRGCVRAAAVRRRRSESRRSRRTRRARPDTRSSTGGNTGPTRGRSSTRTRGRGSASATTSPATRTISPGSATRTRCCCCRRPRAATAWPRASCCADRSDRSSRSTG